MFMLVLTAELDRRTPPVAQVYDDDAEPDMVTMSAYFRSMPIPILNESKRDGPKS